MAIVRDIGEEVENTDSDISPEEKIEWERVSNQVSQHLNWKRSGGEREDNGGESLTHRSSQERIQTPKALERSKRRSRAMPSRSEDTVEEIKSASAAPQSKRSEISSHLKEQFVATELRALIAKAGECPATIAATQNLLVHEKENASMNAQIEVLTDLAKLLLRALEEKEEHANQLETLTETFTQQIKTLQA
jgi:hypothetical protein